MILGRVYKFLITLKRYGVAVITQRCNLIAVSNKSSDVFFFTSDQNTKHENQKLFHVFSVSNYFVSFNNKLIENQSKNTTNAVVEVDKNPFVCFRSKGSDHSTFGNTLSRCFIMNAASRRSIISEVDISRKFDGLASSDAIPMCF